MRRLQLGMFCKSKDASHKYDRHPRGCAPDSRCVACAMSRFMHEGRALHGSRPTQRTSTEIRRRYELMTCAVARPVGCRLDDPCARVTRKNTAPRSYLSNPQLGRVNNKMNHVRRVASPSGERTPGGADYSEKFVYRSGHPRPAAVPCVPRAVGAPQACPQVPPLPAGVRAAGEKEKPPNRTERGTNRGTRTPVAARRRSSEKSTARLIRS